MGLELPQLPYFPQISQEYRSRKNRIYHFMSGKRKTLRRRGQIDIQKRRAKNRRSMLKHLEARRAYQREWYAKNKAVHIERSRLWKEAHPEQAKRNSEEYMIRNKEKIRVYKHDLKWKKKLALFNILGGAKCVRCGFMDMRALQFDHINSDGKIERKKLPWHQAMVDYYIKHPEEARAKLQVLCANCNWIKRSEKDEHKSKIPLTASPI